MATRRRASTNPYSAAGTPNPTNWVDDPSVRENPAGPRIEDGRYNIDQPYDPGANSGFNGGNSGTVDANWNIAPPSRNIGPWIGGIGPQPGNVRIPGQTRDDGSVTPSANSGANGIAGNWLAPNRDMIKAYGQTRGVQLTDQQADYWVNQWSNLMRETPTDPTYALMRLGLADEWTAPDQRYMAGSGGEFSDRWGSNLEQLVSQFLGNSRQRAQGLADTYRNRAKELRDTPAYSAQDEAALQAKAYDQLERRRQETLKNKREQVYARGFAPTSGLVQGAEGDVNTAFEQARTGIASDILRAQLDETNRRKDAATQLEALATEALNGGDLAAIQATGLPLQLMNTRQNSALNLYNASNGNSISSLLSLLLNSAGNNQQTNQQNSQNNAAGYGALLNLISGLFR